jgi:hypothetical protein
VPAVLLSPRSVFFALREEDDDDVAARAEPLLLVIWLAGMAAVLATPAAADILDDPEYDPVLLAIWTFIAGGLYGVVGYFVLGFALYFGVRLLGSLGSFRRSRQTVGFALVPLALVAVPRPPAATRALRRRHVPRRRGRRGLGPARAAGRSARLRRLVARAARPRRPRHARLDVARAATAVVGAAALLAAMLGVFVTL